MSLVGWRGDTLDLLVRESTPTRRTLGVATLALMIGTAIVYALPLERATDDVVSNSMFAVMIVLVITVSASRARTAHGNQRLAWGLVAGAFVITAVLFAFDPQSSDGELSIALDFAVMTSLAYWMAVITLCAPALPGLASLRTAADSLWVTTAFLITVWPWTLGPLLTIDGPSPAERTLYVVFALLSIAFGATVVVIVPHTVGRGRVALWFLGAGGSIASAAGVFHIRFHYEGTLRFGSWWDYLWTLGVGALTFGALATAEDELRPQHRGVRWHGLMTILPLVLAVASLLTLDSGPGLTGALILLVMLSLRVVALLAENDRLNRSLIEAANKDPLTGLANRRALEVGMRRIGDEARAVRRHRAVVVMDLDHFKSVNDNHGHLVGDDILRIVARRLGDAVREQDLLVRHGGDEFIAVMTVRDEEEAIQAGHRLRDAVRGQYALPVGDITLDATIGIALDEGKTDLIKIMAIADDAMYSAKAQARGSIHLRTCADSSEKRVGHLPHK